MSAQRAQAPQADVGVPNRLSPQCGDRRAVDVAVKRPASRTTNGVPQEERRPGAVRTRGRSPLAMPNPTVVGYWPNSRQGNVSGAPAPLGDIEAKRGVGRQAFEVHPVEDRDSHVDVVVELNVMLAFIGA